MDNFDSCLSIRNLFQINVLRKVDWYLLFPIFQDNYSKRISVLIETMAKIKASILAVILLRNSPGKCQKCEFSFCIITYVCKNINFELGIRGGRFNPSYHGIGI